MILTYDGLPVFQPSAFQVSDGRAAYRDSASRTAGLTQEGEFVVGFSVAAGFLAAWAVNANAAHSSGARAA